MRVCIRYTTNNLLGRRLSAVSANRGVSSLVRWLVFYLVR